MFLCSVTTYSPAELLGMLLYKAKEYAEISARDKINNAVLTVPGYFNQAECKALLHAAYLAGLNVMQLVNDYTAGKCKFHACTKPACHDAGNYYVVLTVVML